MRHLLAVKILCALPLASLGLPVTAQAEGWFDIPISGGTQYHQVNSEQALGDLVTAQKAAGRIMIDIEPFIPGECQRIEGKECVHYRALTTKNIHDLDWAVHANMQGEAQWLDKADSPWRKSGHAGLRIADLNVLPVKHSWKAKDKGGTEGLHYNSVPHVTALMVENREQAEWYFFYDVDALKLDELRLDYGQEKDLAVTGFAPVSLNHWTLMVQNGEADQITSSNFVVYTKDVKGREHHFASAKSTPAQIKQRQDWGYRPYMHTAGRIGWIKDGSQKVVFGPEVTDEGSWHKGRIEQGLEYALVDLSWAGNYAAEDEYVGQALWALPARDTTSGKPGWAQPQPESEADTPERATLATKPARQTRPVRQKRDDN